MPEVKQELMFTNTARSRTSKCDTLFRGVVQSVFYRSYSATGETYWQTYCDIQLSGFMQPYLKKVPIAITKSNINNGEDWVPEIGDSVLVQFINGRISDPVITGFLFSYDVGDEGLQPQQGEVPAGKSRYFKRCNNTSETIDKDGNRIISVAGDDTLTVTGDGSVTIGGNMSVNVTGTATITVTGNATISSDGNVTVEAGGTASVTGAVVEVESAGNVSITGTGTVTATSTGAMSLTSSAGACSIGGTAMNVTSSGVISIASSGQVNISGTNVAISA